MSIPRALSLAIAAFSALSLALPASAAQDDGTEDSRMMQSAAIFVPPPPTYPVYVVPYIRAGDGASTVVTVTNVGATACTTAVDWKVGVGGVACTTYLTVNGGAPIGDALDHCTNPTVVGCNATCPQPGPFGFRVEGAAVVRTEAHCRNTVAVDARVYYFDGDFQVQGVADLKLVKLPAGNKGE
jgi:hypothetical protein